MLQASAIILILLFKFSTSQDANCNFQQTVAVGNTYFVYSPGYPANYSRGIQCRWVGICPTGYNCRLDCSEINIPYAPSCSIDRLLVSRTGDLQLNGADPYCGLGTLSVTSTGTSISVGLIVSRTSPGGRFSCQLTAQPAAPVNSCRCGYKKGNRIVGGQETQVNEFPMMAGVVDRRIFQIKCGAVIINTRSVVSAAHCIAGQNAAVDFAIVVGEHNVDTGSETSATQGLLIANVMIHPSYSSSNYDYDVAIINTRGEIVFSDLVGPVCLPFKFTNFDFTGRTVTALGWGTTFIGGPVSKVLRKVDLQIISQATCRSYNPLLTNRQICTLTPGKDSCQDDSGGPLLYTDPATGLLFHVGIISSGSYCASNSPSINTRVTEILNWIVANAPYNYCRK